MGQLLSTRFLSGLLIQMAFAAQCAYLQLSGPLRIQARAHERRFVLPPSRSDPMQRYQREEHIAPGSTDPRLRRLRLRRGPDANLLIFILTAAVAAILWVFLQL